MGQMQLPLDFGEVRPECSIGGCRNEAAQRVTEKRQKSEHTSPKRVFYRCLVHADLETVQWLTPGRSAGIVWDCLAGNEPFFVLRAKDIFSVMAVHNYEKMVEEYGPLDLEFHEAVSRQVSAMREWQMQHPELVKYPD